MLTVKPLPPLEPHQRRVFDEAIELSRRRSALNEFIVTPTFGALPPAEQTLLVAQLGAMLTYEATLNARIELWCRAEEKAGLPTTPAEDQGTDSLRPSR